jgi:hypothetical protein
MAQEKKRVQTQIKSENSSQPDEDTPKTLADLEKLGQKLVQEGRMPSPEVFDRVMSEARRRWRKRH